MSSAIAARTIKATPRIGGIEYPLEVPADLAEQVRISSNDHLLKAGRKPLGQTALVKVVHCIQELDKVDAILWPTQMVNICADWKVSKTLFQRCWNDFNARRDGIEQRELFPGFMSSCVVEGRF